MRTEKFWYWVVAVMMAAFLGFVVGFLASWHSKTGVKGLEIELQAKKKELQTKLTEAKAIVDEAKKEAEGHVLRHREEMYKVYPRLSKYEYGENVVNRKYIKSFRIDRGTLKIKMTNDSYSKVKPNAEITFFNKQGFVTMHREVEWLINSVGPGETRFSKKSATFLFGEPVYYVVQVK